ncbi:SIMPL domain-containing protein [Sphingomonas sp. S1-29]|uniref:SIMPL domain-containing protein n=1 Tax=Sphingomonas sp. S1-29 TaxID=2991074 RepID=UPI002240C1AD|nr:SIMPL domain-containing protein [Sphingomonas sp. S1-29]UZK68399.1 SIMPL domain-containing protein [Sphingomonas sp. S1-29]
MRFLTLTAAILAQGALPVAAQTTAATAVPADVTLLDVVAEGRTTRVPDLATIGAGVVTQAATASEAMTTNATAMARVLAALKRAGVADRDVQTASISLSPQYRYGENQPPILTGYQASNRVNVRFRDIARSGTILDALVSAGSNQIDGPNLTLAEPDAAMDEARADAVKRARTRAELYARAAGLRVDRIVSISESGQIAQPMPVMMQSARMEADVRTKIAPGEQEVEITLNVRFALR